MAVNKEEFKNRISNSPNIDIRIKRNLYEQIDDDPDTVKLVNGIEIEKRYTPNIFKAMLYQEEVDFNAMAEDLEDKLEIFDSLHFESVDFRTRNATKTVSRERFSLWMQGKDYVDLQNPSKEATKIFNVDNLTNIEKLFYRNFKSKRQSFADKQTGITNETRDNFNKLLELTQYLQINDRAIKNDKPAPFSTVELKAVRAEIQDISMNNIEKMVMSNMLQEMGDSTAKRIRHDAFATGGGMTMLVTNPKDPDGPPIEYTVTSETEFQDKMVEEATWRTEQLIKQFNKTLGISF